MLHRLLIGSLALVLAACARFAPEQAAKVPGLVAAAAFAPDGRLWRVSAGKEHVFVDYSEDEGRHFSPPVEVNPNPQPIRATSEDRPGIAIDETGRIMVVYAAASAAIPWSVYYSFSSDGGRRFSAPQPIAPNSAKTYQVRLGAAGNTFHLLWHQGEASGSTGTSLHWAVLSDLQHPPQSRTIADRQCECCRIALAFDPNHQPVLLTRFVFPGVIRDHGLIFPAALGQARVHRVSFDDWQLQACPEHGPALAISPEGRLHLVWFTLGRSRKGLFYAHSDDRGRTVSDPMAVGNPGALAGHPDVLAKGSRVVLVWQEFDGQKIQVKAIQSQDRGENWSSPQLLATSKGAADYPFLLARGDAIYLSWNTEADYRLISIPKSP